MAGAWIGDDIDRAETLPERFFDTGGDSYDCCHGTVIYASVQCDRGRHPAGLGRNKVHLRTWTVLVLPHAVRHHCPAGRLYSYVDTDPDRGPFVRPGIQENMRRTEKVLDIIRQIVYDMESH